MVFGSFIVSHFESVWAAVYTSSLKRALDRQQQSKHTHKVQRVPRRNKLSKTVKPCTTCSTSKGKVISNFKSQRYSETWWAVTLRAGESEWAAPSWHNNYCWGPHNQNTQQANCSSCAADDAVEKNAKWLPGVDVYRLRRALQLINNIRSH